MNYKLLITAEELDERSNIIISLIHTAFIYAPKEEVYEILEQIDFIDSEMFSQLTKQAVNYQKITGLDKKYEDVEHLPDVVKYVDDMRPFFDYFYDYAVKEVK